MNRNKTKKEHKALCGMVSGKRAVSLLLAVPVSYTHLRAHET